MFKSFLFKAMSLFIPKILVRRRQGPKWFDSEIRHYQKCLRTMRRKLKSHPTLHNMNKVKCIEDILQSKLVQAKTNFETELIKGHSHKPSAIYSYIRSLTGRDSLPSIMYLDSKNAATDFEKADLFNQYFYSVFTKSSFHIPPISELKRPQKYIGEIAITELDVFYALRALDTSKAVGCDGISPKVLKHCALALYQPLYHLFSLSLTQHYLPVEWHTHLIKPIFKSGERNSIRNYRPISLLCVVSKVLERLVYKNIVDFVKEFIYVNQFAFLRGRSTLQQLLIFFNSLFNSASQTDVAYLDFRKAFDSVAHNELLYKLWNFGISLMIFGCGYKLTSAIDISVCQLVSPCRVSFLLFLVFHRVAFSVHFCFLFSLTIYLLQCPLPWRCFLLMMPSV